MILYRYILKQHFAPFFFSLITLIFVFLLQFLMKFADKLVGKGLGFWIIAQLITYSLAWIVVLVGPMAVLVAVLMAYGSLSQNNEIACMKAAGISLYKMMFPSILASVVLALLLIQFNNNVYPDANHKLRLLQDDIRNKKPTLSLTPGIFSQEINYYAILVRNSDPNSNRLEGMLIYDYTNPFKTNIVSAKKGNVYFSKDQKKLIMDLEDGEIHEFDFNDQKAYRKMIFDNHKIAMDASQFSFQQSTSSFRGERELGAPEMLIIADSLKKLKNVKEEKYLSDFESYILAKKNAPGIRNSSPNTTDHHILLRIEDRLRYAKTSMLADSDNLLNSTKEINKYMVEVHKKYSLPAACIIFVLIGAPLGIMIRKGGFGVAAGISLMFFLIYWVFLIGGEKLADRGMLSPFWGMWGANFFLGALGVWLTIKAAKEQVNLDFSFLQKLIPKLWRNPQESTNENS